MSRISRLRHVRELYTKGTVVELIDGTPLWVRVLNPFEQDEARSEAQIARARMMLSIKEDSGSGERARVRGYYFDDGIEGATEILVNAKIAERLGKISDKLRFDPEWKERLDILARGHEKTATILEDSEKELLEKIAADYAAEMTRLIAEERDYLQGIYAEGDEELLWNDYLDVYAERRGTEAALAEHRVHQILFGTYLCGGSAVDGEWVHTECRHDERLFSDVSEVRDVPEEVLTAIVAAISRLDMSVVEAKNSDRQGSSTDSSPLPSDQAESTPSTQTETLTEPTGS